MQSGKPFDVATCMYYTGIDPFTKQQVHVDRQLRDRKLQRALMQFFKPANYFAVREALMKAGRADLIGNGCDALIPATPPQEALTARREQANDAARGDYVHTVPNPAKGVQVSPSNKGYRPGRETRQQRARP